MTLPFDQESALVGPWKFNGTVTCGGEAIELTFSALINKSGRLILDIPPVPADDAVQKFYFSSFRDGLLTIEGISQDGRRIISNDLLLTNKGLNSSETGTFLSMKGECSNSRISVPSTSNEGKIVFRFYLTGMRGFRTLSNTQDTIKIQFSCATQENDKDELCGILQASIDNYENSGDLEEIIPRKLDDVLRVLSLSSGRHEKPRLEVYYKPSEVVYRTHNYGEVSGRGINFFSHLNLGPIFDCAVEAAFNKPPALMNGLRFAIEWLLMPASHTEIRLVGYMTALEHLTGRNLPSASCQILPDEEFEAAKKAVKKVLKSLEISDRVIDRIKPKNYTSLAENIWTLLHHWNISTLEITQDDVNKIVRIRNDVLHRGLHKSSNQKQHPSELWQYTMIARELCARLILQRLGFNGSYFSMMGGWHTRHFPSCARQK